MNDPKPLTREERQVLHDYLACFDDDAHNMVKNAMAHYEATIRALEAERDSWRNKALDRN
jgi:hypothetical protein